VKVALLTLRQFAHSQLLHNGMDVTANLTVFAAVTSLEATVLLSEVLGGHFFYFI
jgi:hypothetical protein